jgi:two-component system, OmpR family, phosphate regulon sensor histidine kinase PhoR
MFPDVNLSYGLGNPAGMQQIRPFFPLMWPFTKSNPRPDQESSTKAAGELPIQAAELIGALPDPVLLIGRNGVVLMANAHIKAVLDTNPEGLHLSASVRAPAVLDAVNAVLAGESAHHVDYDLRFPVPRSFQAFVAPFGNSQGALIVLRDLTREQHIERMRADFVANASHELRTPLASLSGFIETIEGAAKNDEKAKAKFLGLMRSQADRMSRLINDLLSLSRIEMNEHVRPSSEVDMAQVAYHARDILSGMAKDMECEIRVVCEAPLAVLGNRDELVQVMQNLVENALKYGGTGKLVEIEGRKADGQVEISVRDHGPGIAEEHIPRLTERFYRVNVQDSRSRGGTGLGLAIVKHILIRHRGRLTISSKLGEGSVFAIRLPQK